MRSSIAACLSAVLACLAQLHAAAGQPEAPAQTIRQQSAILCVIDFANLRPNKDTDYVGTALGESISSRLAEMKLSKVVERAQLRKVQEELLLRRSDLVDSKTAAELGRMLGATHMVVGSYEVVLFPERRTVNVRLVHVETAAAVWGGQFTGGTQAEVEAEVLKGLSGGAVGSIDAGEARSRGLSLAAEGKLDEALQLLWPLVEKSPADVALHRAIAGCATDRTKARELVDRYQRLVAQQPSSAVVQNYLGNALLTLDPQDSTGQATAAYEKAQKLDPSFTPPVTNLAAIPYNTAKANVAAGQPKKAMEGFRRAREGFRAYLAKESRDAPGWANLAQVCADLVRCSKSGGADDPVARDRDEAAWLAEGAEAAQRAIELDCRQSRAWRWLGALRELAGKAQDAIPAYRQAIAMDGRQADLAQHLKELEAKTEAPKEDEFWAGMPPQLRSAEFRHNVDRAVLSARYMQTLAAAQAADAAPAIDLCTWALRDDADSALGWLVKARVCLRAGRKAEAAAALAKAEAARADASKLPLYTRLSEEISRP